MDKNYAEFLLKKTKEDYNLIAEDFSRTREGIWEEIRFLFENYLKEGDKVLDVGCGNGRCYTLIKSKNVEYFGIDNSEKLINLARGKYPKAKFQVADALNLPFQDSFFDKIYNIAVFHHIPSKELRLKFLKEAKRVLKPDGLLILTVWKFHEKREKFLLFKYTLLKIFGLSKLDFGDILEPWGRKVERYYHWFSEKELADLVEQTDFKLQKIDVVKNERGNRQNIYLIAQK